jgi:hypothetical protein
MTETPIKIPKWLSARVYNLNLVPDAVGYDEMRHYSAEDIVWLLNQISDEDEIREYATVDCGDGVTIELPSRIRFKANMPNFEWTSCRLDYYDKVEHRYPPVLFSTLTVPFNRLAIGAIVENNEGIRYMKTYCDGFTLWIDSNNIEVENDDAWMLERINTKPDAWLVWP